MSNCIRFDNPHVRFEASEIDIPKLRELWEEVEYLKSAPPLSYTEKDSPEEIRANSAWWFLSPSFGPNDRHVWLEFGGGNSAHTNRDFRGFLEVVIKPLMKKSKIHEFLIRDEGDEFVTVAKLKIDFLVGWPN